MVLGHDGGIDEADDTGRSSPGEVSYCPEEWSYSLELTDEYAVDGEVGKRLNQMVPVPVSVASMSGLYEYYRRYTKDNMLLISIEAFILCGIYSYYTLLCY